MMVIMLTSRDRKKFIGWLDQEVAVNERLIGQLSKINQRHAARKLREEIAASIVVAAKLKLIDKGMD